MKPWAPIPQFAHLTILGPVDEVEQAPRRHFGEFFRQGYLPEVG
jgi:hypothetical protein